MVKFLFKGIEMFSYRNIPGSTKYTDPVTCLTEGTHVQIHYQQYLSGRMQATKKVPGELL